MRAANLLFNISGGIRRWGWKFNDSLGICVPASVEDLRTAKATTARSTWRRVLYVLGFRPPGDFYTRVLYVQYLATLGEKPGPTMGVDPGSFLAWMKANGHIIEWANVPVLPGSSAADQAAQAGAQYRGAILTINLTENMYANDFYSRRPWGIDGNGGDVPLPTLSHEIALVRTTESANVIATWDRTKVMTLPCGDLTIRAIHVFLTVEDKADPRFPAMLSAMQAAASLPGGRQ